MFKALLNSRSLALFVLLAALVFAAIRYCSAPPAHKDSSHSEAISVTGE